MVAMSERRGERKTRFIRVGACEADDASDTLYERIPPGGRLVRVYRGETHVVKVLPDSFEYNGRAFKSLSAIAKVIARCAANAANAKWRRERAGGGTHVARCRANESAWITRQNARNCVVASRFEVHTQQGPTAWSI